MPDRAMAWVDRACLPLMGVMSAWIAVLNFRAEHNFHTIDKHLVFRARILHGFATTDGALRDRHAVRRLLRS